MDLSMYLSVVETSHKCVFLELCITMCITKPLFLIDTYIFRKMWLNSLLAAWEHKQNIIAGLVKAKAGLSENPLINSFTSSIATGLAIQQISYSQTAAPVMFFCGKSSESTGWLLHKVLSLMQFHLALDNEFLFSNASLQPIWFSCIEHFVVSFVKRE